MVLLMLMVYGVGSALGEAVRERVFGSSRSYWLYSGLFGLLRLEGEGELRRYSLRSWNSSSPCSLGPCSLLSQPLMAEAQPC